jgi:hypothetical protein
MKAGRSSIYDMNYIIETNWISVEVDLNCGPGDILIDSFDPSNFPPGFIIGIDVVVYFEFFVEIVGFELWDGFFEHTLNIYLRKIYFELMIAFNLIPKKTYQKSTNQLYSFHFSLTVKIVKKHLSLLACSSLKQSIRT